MASITQQGNYKIIQLDTITAMKAFVAKFDGQKVYVKGNTAAYDGGGGEFYWNATSTATQDSITIFQRDDLGANPGRWIRSLQNIEKLRLTSMANLIAITSPYDGQTVTIYGFYTFNDGGGGTFKYDSSASKTTHDGGTVIDPDIGVTPGSAGWWTAPGSGTGVWKRTEIDGGYVINWFGAKGDGLNDDTSAFNGAYAAKQHVIFLVGEYLFSSMPNQISANGSRILGQSFKQGNNTSTKIQTIIKYTATSGVLFDVTASSCELGNFWIIGPGTAGSDIAVQFNDSWRNALRKFRIEDVYTAFKNEAVSFDNVVEYFYITNCFRGLHHNGGSSGSISHGYISNGSALVATSRAIYLESITHMSIWDVQIADGFAYAIFVDAVQSLLLLDTHCEQVLSGANAAENDIRMTSSTTQLTIQGGRYGSANLNGKTIRMSSSGNLISISGPRIVSNPNGLIDDFAGGYVVAHATNIQSSDLANGAAGYYLLGRETDLLLDESGNITSPATVQGLNVVSRDGYLQTSNFYARRYSLRKTGIAANTSTDFFKTTTTNGIVNGIVQIAAVRIASSEQSFKHYQIYADQSGTQVNLIGSGRDSGAGVTLTIARSGTDVTLTAVTDALWAGGDIIINVMADLTSYATISFTDL